MTRYPWEKSMSSWRFIYWAKSEYRDKCIRIETDYVEGYARPRYVLYVDPALCRYLYDVGVMFGVLDPQLESYARFESTLNYSIEDQHPNYYRWCRRPRTPFREKQQKGVVSEKKSESSESQAKKDWREKKGFRRDKSKHKATDSIRGRSKVWAKKLSNKWNRRHTRDAITHGEYDDMLTLNQIHDRWMID